MTGQWEQGGRGAAGCTGETTLHLHHHFCLMYFEAVMCLVIENSYMLQINGPLDEEIAFFTR